MGCSASVTYSRAHMSSLHSEAYITHRQRLLVKKTWRYFASDMTRIGGVVFLNIFRLNPSIKQLFPCKDKEGDDLWHDSNFRGHASRFMQAVGAVVDNMDALDESLTPLLIGLGRQHVSYRGFVSENFDIFTDAMTAAWSEELGARFTSEVQDAWQAVFGFIMMKMKHGFQLAS